MLTGNKPLHIRSRLAPTPSGYLHIGNAFSFVLTSLIVQSHRGSLLLRIDDLDQTRKRDRFVEDIFYSLDWLGLSYQEGPTGPDDFEASYSQIHRQDLYEKALFQLEELGIIYLCKCSRKELQIQQQLGIPYCPCRQLEGVDPKVAWAQRVHTSKGEFVEWNDRHLGAQKAVIHSQLPNFVVRKKDGQPAYQLSSLVDDLFYKVNFIVRGEDLLASTAAQLWLAQRMGKESFVQAQFLHHPLITNGKREKLSKSKGALALYQLKEKWPSPAPVFRLFSRWLKLPEPAETLTEMLPLFQATYG